MGKEETEVSPEESKPSFLSGLARRDPLFEGGLPPAMEAAQTDHDL